MARFYMHHHSGAHVTTDDEGYDYVTLAQMRYEAVWAARELMMDSIMRGEVPGMDELFEITDVHGVLLLTFHFREALDGDPSPPYPPLSLWNELN